MRISLVCLLGSTASVFAGPPTVVYSTIPSSPTSDVPGLSSKFISFDRPNPSQNGRRWISVASIDSGDTATDNVLLIGDGAQAIVAAREGVTDIEDGRVPGGLTGDRRGSIRNDGVWSYSFDLSGFTTDDRYVVRGQGQAFSLVFREGEPIVGISGASWGQSINEAHILNDDSISVRATLAGVPTTMDTGLFRRDPSGLVSTLAREQTNTPSGQTGTPQLINSFGFNSFSQSADGATWTARASLVGAAATNEVLLKNDQVIVQEGVTIAGLAAPVQTLYGRGIIGGDNRVYSAGWTTSGAAEAFVLRDGVLLAKIGDPVVQGSPEVWDSTVWNTTSGKGFWLYTADAAGNYVIGGFTNGAADQNAVIVYNSTRVLLREGDAVDVNGDGEFNDDAFYDMPASALTGASLGNHIEDGWLSDNCFFYKVIFLRDSSGAGIGEALIRIDLRECPADFNCDGGVDGDDVIAFFGAWDASLPEADFNQDGGVDGDDVIAFFARWDTGC